LEEILKKIKEEKDFLKTEIVKLFISIISANNQSFEVEWKKLFVPYFEESLLIWESLKILEKKTDNFQSIIATIKHSINNYDSDVYSLDTKTLDSLKESLEQNEKSSLLSVIVQYTLFFILFWIFFGQTIMQKFL
jgi:hypothetical protein